MGPTFDVLVVNVTVVVGQTALLPCSIQHLGRHKVGLHRLIENLYFTRMNISGSKKNKKNIKLNNLTINMNSQHVQHDKVGNTWYCTEQNNLQLLLLVFLLWCVSILVTTEINSMPVSSITNSLTALCQSRFGTLTALWKKTLLVLYFCFNIISSCVTHEIH